MNEYTVDPFTCISFDQTGEFLAAGDKGGHIVVFRCNAKLRKIYDIYCSFTSHESEFDYLKSLEIEEKINSITWLTKLNPSNHLLSTNDSILNELLLSLICIPCISYSIDNQD
ncbi:unnamed protein product [Protopolystoma xenopodis]|uniref:Uncharacterized protein n=1 Tax=Protopolystoma xenopodis TaxID=117903 RepID=A0A448XJF2_9PLAT|nr:unnamed protein product [Protopolystoma xenopodis]